MGRSFRRDLKLISEVQDPFRGVRKFFYLALFAAAGISTLFTVPRFIQAIQGGDGAPGLLETVQNLAINVGGTYFGTSCIPMRQTVVIYLSQTLLTSNAFAREFLRAHVFLIWLAKNRVKD